MLFTENEPSWGIRKEQILSSSELLPNFLNCELEADGWYESLENSISYLSEIAPDDYRVIEAITDSYKAGRELFKNVEDKSKNQLVRTLIFIGFEVGLENDTLFLSEDIIEKLNSAELIDLSDRDKIDFAYRTVCNLLRNGVKIREQAMSVDTESRNVQNHELASGKKTADSTVFSKYINQALDLKALE